MSAKASGGLLIAIFIAAGALRLSFPTDIEYKSDEAYMFENVERYRATGNLPSVGLSSGVHIKNPPLSVWSFIAMGTLSNAQTPADLNRWVGALGFLSLLILYFLVVPKVSSEFQPYWRTAIALMAVSPFLVAYERKLWAQSILSIFLASFLSFFVRREHRIFSFSSGLILALMGQVHMSGFFFMAATGLYLFLFERRKTLWQPAALGIAIGLLPLFPPFSSWLPTLLTGPAIPSQAAHTVTLSSRLDEILQLKLLVFWLTTPSGIHLGNILGVKNGNGFLEQITDFLRFPQIFGTPTYLVGLAHFVLVSAVLLSVMGAAKVFFTKKFDQRLWDTHTKALFWIGLIYGVILTLTGVPVRRYYVLILYPIPFVWFALTIENALKWFREKPLPFMAVIVLSLFIISASFLQFIRTYGGAPQGDFGTSYRIQVERNDLARSRE